MIDSKKKNNILALGIDFGTTYSLVSTIKKGNAILLKDNQGCYLLPSVINFNKNNILFGAKAENKIVEDPVNTITSVKRLIGRSVNFIKEKFPNLPYIISKDEDGDIFFRTDAGLITPIDVVSKILKFLKKRAYSQFNTLLDATVITVPAYFNNIQRKSIKKSAILAKINLIRLLNEPTSAAIAYGLQLQKQGIVVVYDLGGGTFDISILKLNKGIFEVIATSGDTNLGGDDFDICLAEYIYKKSKLSKKCNNIFQALLIQTAKQAKIQLTQFKKTKVNICNWSGIITRDEFNFVIKHLVQRTLLICMNVLQEIDLSKKNISEIIMVGGSTRIPIIGEEIQKFFNKKPLCSINPDQVVAIGAAIQADMLTKNILKNKTVLLDVIPISLGIEVMGGFVEKIILKNTSIPISKAKEFTTAVDNQTSILIHVLQGEDELVKDCVSLSRFIFKNLPRRKAGVIRILVIFEVNTDGLINIVTLEKFSKKEKRIQIDNITALKNTSNIL